MKKLFIMLINFLVFINLMSCVLISDLKKNSEIVYVQEPKYIELYENYNIGRKPYLYKESYLVNDFGNIRVYRYDKNMNIVQSIYCKNDENNEKHGHFYFYDKQNRVVRKERIEYRKYGIKLFWFTLNKYDNNGNKIFHGKYDASGKCSETLERKYKDGKNVYYCFKKNGVITNEGYYKYNENGQRTSYIVYNKGELESKYLSFYNEKGLLIKSEYYISEYTLKTVIDYKYDKKNRLVEEINNEYGKIRRRRIYEYDENDNLIKLTITNPYYSTDVLYFEYKYRNNLLVETIRYFRDKDEKSIATYLYDDNRKILKYDCIDDIGNYLEGKEYEYDDFGNIILFKEYIEDRKIRTFTKYDYRYY